MSRNLVLPEDYHDWLSSLKQRIAGARQRIVLSANAEQIKLYHEIGLEILDRQTRQEWGSKVIDRLANDLREAFPDMRGFSSSNLKYMRQFAQECPEVQIGQQSADQLPWFHIVTILTKIPDANTREWYAIQTAQHGWARDTLTANINSQLYQRQGAAITNFEKNLPAPHAGIATHILKDPYHFDVRRVVVCSIPDSVRRSLGRKCLSQPTYPHPKGDGNHSMLVKQRTEKKCPNRCTARLAKQGEGHTARTSAPTGSKVIPSERHLKPTLTVQAFKSKTLETPTVQGDAQ